VPLLSSRVNGVAIALAAVLQLQALDDAAQGDLALIALVGELSHRQW
jgi:hypothetical protein